MKLGQIIVFLFLPIAIPKTESFPQKQILKVRYSWGGHQRQWKNKKAVYVDGIQTTE